MEVLKYLKLYIKARYMENQMVSLTERGRLNICSLIGCSLLDLDIAITMLKVSKEIVIRRQSIVQVSF
jgi:hypothetical protein